MFALLGRPKFPRATHEAPNFVVDSLRDELRDLSTRQPSGAGPYLQSFLFYQHLFFKAEMMSKQKSDPPQKK